MSHKFEDEFAEDLYRASLNGLNDDGLGDTADFGWHGLFLKDLAILTEDNYGFVSVTRFASLGDLEEAWDILQDEYNEFEYEDAYGYEDEYYESGFESDLYDDDPFEF
jgi:hypothetical protein